MNTEHVERIANAALYEGYLLYPYRRSALKNRHRWNFGILYPAGMTPRAMTTECLVEGSAECVVDVQVRFLQVDPDPDAIQDAIERRVTFSVGLSGTPYTHRFEFDGLRGVVHVAVTRLEDDVWRLHVAITNETPSEAGIDPLHLSLVSTHTILSTADGQFVSLLDPPERLTHAASGCVNVGTWPALAGPAGTRKCVLSSPIILYDYPAIADESPGDLFDGTEIDELLTLRIQTLTDAEKEEVRQSGPRARQLLERAEAMTAADLWRLHGVARRVAPGGDLQKGDRVRLHPRPGADAFDIVLKDRVAIVESIERDMEDRIHVAVVIEDDPGRDLGVLGQPGHRFFFAPDELERLP